MATAKSVLFYCYCIQAWVRDGIITKCGHPPGFSPPCHGCRHGGKAHDCPECEGRLIEVTPPHLARYRLIEDPGHGWLEVPTQELRELGIYADISAYSFQSREDCGFSYLEEDCDIQRFADAKGWGPGVPWPIRTVHQEVTFVRNLPRFDPERKA